MSVKNDVTKGEVFGCVYSTNDYDIFKHLKGNRILDDRKNYIISSIKENGWVTNPIIVNKDMEIINGQHRYAALKALNMPIQYIIAENANIHDCIALNIKQQNWKLVDYIRCYADMGNDDYVFWFRSWKNIMARFQRA